VGVNKFEIRRIVENYVTTTNQTEIFKNGSPGKKWLKLFMKRWNKDLSLRTPQNLPKSRAIAVSQECIDEFFSMVVWLTPQPRSKVARKYGEEVTEEEVIKRREEEEKLKEEKKRQIEERKVENMKKRAQREKIKADKVKVREEKKRKKLKRKELKKLVEGLKSRNAMYAVYYIKMKKKLKNPNGYHVKNVTGGRVRHVYQKAFMCQMILSVRNVNKSFFFEKPAVIYI
jgi:hypothetical protein